MTTTWGERKENERKYLERRREKEQKEIQQLLTESLGADKITVLSCVPSSEEYLTVNIMFVLDGHEQEDRMLWKFDESMEEFAVKTKRHIDYIKELRQKYPEYCKQNDFIQSHGKFNKKLVLTHMGYHREFNFHVELADYLKLPNTTTCSCGGGDYEIKRTPKRVKEYNQNIDLAINFLIDCIAELKPQKYTETKEESHGNL